MGWHGTGAMDGDDGMDLRSTVFYKIGVKDQDSPFVAQRKLMENQDLLYDWIKDYDWEKNHSHNPGFTQEVYIQALLQLFLDYGVLISKRGIKGGIPFIENDHWAQDDKKRKNSMDLLKYEVESQMTRLIKSI